MDDKLLALSHLDLFKQIFAFKEDATQNITASGVVVSTLKANQIENGEFIDFHKGKDFGVDYTCRLIETGTTNRQVALPNEGGEIATKSWVNSQRSIVPTSQVNSILSAGGGLKCRLSLILNNLFGKKEVIYGW